MLKLVRVEHAFQLLVCSWLHLTQPGADTKARSRPGTQLSLNATHKSATDFASRLPLQQPDVPNLLGQIVCIDLLTHLLLESLQPPRRFRLPQRQPDTLDAIEEDAEPASVHHDRLAIQHVLAELRIDQRHPVIITVRTGPKLYVRLGRPDPVFVEDQDREDGQRDTDIMSELRLRLTKTCKQEYTIAEGGPAAGEDTGEYP